VWQPLIGGAVGQAGGWHAIFYLVSAYGGIAVVLLIIVLPETLPAAKRRSVNTPLCRSLSLTHIADARDTGPAGLHRGGR
jgi:DHA1 family bicyclomycin/chloramphenicol resistance-like MFS transporter